MLIIWWMMKLFFIRLFQSMAANVSINQFVLQLYIYIFFKFLNCDPRYSPSNINYSDVYNAELHLMMYTGNTWRSGGIGACPYPYGLGVTGTQSLFILSVVVNRGTLSPAQIHSPCLTPIWYLFVPGQFL